MLAKNLFVTIKEDAIKTANIIIRKRTYLTFKTFIKFNDTLIQLIPSSDILLS